MGGGGSKTKTAAEPYVGTPFYDRFDGGFRSGDIEKAADCLTDDFEFVFHASGKSVTKEQWKGMMGGFLKMMGDDQEKWYAKKRCIYESATICVSHNFSKFPNGTVDAVLMVMLSATASATRWRPAARRCPSTRPTSLARRRRRRRKRASSPPRSAPRTATTRSERVAVSALRSRLWLRLRATEVLEF